MAAAFVAMVAAKSAALVYTMVSAVAVAMKNVGVPVMMAVVTAVSVPHPHQVPRNNIDYIVYRSTPRGTVLFTLPSLVVTTTIRDQCHKTSFFVTNEWAK